MSKGSTRSVVANLLDCDIVENEFELQSRFDIHVRTNTLGKGLNALVLNNPLMLIHLLPKKLKQTKTITQFPYDEKSFILDF